MISDWHVGLFHHSARAWSLYRASIGPWWWQCLENYRAWWGVVLNEVGQVVPSSYRMWTSSSLVDSHFIVANIKRTKTQCGLVCILIQPAKVASRLEHIPITYDSLFCRFSRCKLSTHMKAFIIQKYV